MLARLAFAPGTMLLALVTLVALLFTPALEAHAAPTPKDFVQSAVDRGVSILSDGGLSQEARRKEFRQFILNLTDSRRIALFTLGKYRRQASDADVSAFVDAFTEYAVAVYEARLDDYKGEKLRVTDVVERSAKDVIVTTIVEDSGSEPIRVAFRLNPKGDSYIVIDVQVVGIWLALDQQSQFSSFLSKNNGSVPALTAHLKQQTAEIQAGRAEN